MLCAGVLSPQGHLAVLYSLPLSAWQPSSGDSSFTVDHLSHLDATASHAALAGVKALCEQLYSGLDIGVELSAVKQHNLGEVLLLYSHGKSMMVILGCYGSSTLIHAYTHSGTTACASHLLKLTRQWRYFEQPAGKDHVHGHCGNVDQ